MILNIFTSLISKVKMYIQKIKNKREDKKLLQQSEKILKRLYVELKEVEKQLSNKKKEYIRGNVSVKEEVDTLEIKLNKIQNEIEKNERNLRVLEEKLRL